MTQIEAIVDYINENGSITAKQAEDIGVRRLASRIHEIKQFRAVRTETIRVKSRYGKASVARYSWDG